MQRYAQLARLELGLLLSYLASTNDVYSRAYGDDHRVVCLHAPRVVESTKARLYRVGWPPRTTNGTTKSSAKVLRTSECYRPCAFALHNEELTRADSPCRVVQLGASTSYPGLDVQGGEQTT